MAPIAVPPTTSVLSDASPSSLTASSSAKKLSSLSQVKNGAPVTTTTTTEPLQMRASSSGIASNNQNGSVSYDQSLRPQIHYSPSSGFMNDPNGLVVSGKPGNETLHLYYQYNPTANVAGNQHWGHATSKSFESHEWHNHQPALAPANSSEGIFSGSAVIDHNNTSGFFDDSTEPEDRMVAIYTLNTPDEQTQYVAYSTDGGYNYTKYDQNPVLTHKGTFQTQFRDPKVFWDEPRSQWVMAVAHTQEYEVGFYTSPDLKDWTSASNFSMAGILGFQYECPALFQAPIVGGPKDGQMAWVMLISVNPGAPQGGSFNQYFIGDWDGKTFTSDDAAARAADFGKDWYAAQTWSNTGNKTYVIGWASNWQYTNVVPTSPWRSTLSLVREITIQWAGYNPLKQGYVMAMNPVSTDSIVSKELHSSSNTAIKANDTVQLQGNGAFEINATLSLTADNYTNATTDSFIELRVYAGDDKKQFLRVGLFGGEQGGVYIDRRKAGTQWADENVWFTDRFSAHPEPLLTADEDEKKSYNLRLIVDRSISELYVNNGTAVATVLHFWDDGAIPSSLEIKSGDGKVDIDSLSVKALESTWKKQESQ